MARGPTLLLLLLLGTGLLARAEAPRVQCMAVRTGNRVVVRTVVEGFVDSDLARLVQLGLHGRLELSVALVQHRFLWLDAKVDATHVSQVLTYSARQGWALDGRWLPEGPRSLSLERVALSAPDPAARGLVVQVQARLQVVTAQSLGRVASWLTPGKEEERSAVTENLVRTVAEDLIRSASAQCEVPPTGPGD